MLILGFAVNTECSRTIVNLLWPQTTTTCCVFYLPRIASYKRPKSILTANVLCGKSRRSSLSLSPAIQLRLPRLTVSTCRKLTNVAANLQWLSKNTDDKRIASSSISRRLQPHAPAFPRCPRNPIPCFTTEYSNTLSEHLQALLSGWDELFDIRLWPWNSIDRDSEQRFRLASFTAS
jgi:hypothetical protein